jgi:hypothetical protein
MRLSNNFLNLQQEPALPLGIVVINSETFSPHFSQGSVARRCKRMWMQGLRPRTPEAYFRYVEESEGA